MKIKLFILQFRSFYSKTGHISTKNSSVFYQITILMHSLKGPLVITKTLTIL